MIRDWLLKRLFEGCITSAVQVEGENEGWGSRKGGWECSEAVPGSVSHSSCRPGTSPDAPSPTPTTQCCLKLWNAGLWICWRHSCPDTCRSSTRSTRSTWTYALTCTGFTETLVGCLTSDSPVPAEDRGSVSQRHGQAEDDVPDRGRRLQEGQHGALVHRGVSRSQRSRGDTLQHHQGSSVSTLTRDLACLFVYTSPLVSKSLRTFGFSIQVPEFQRSGTKEVSE